MSDEWMSAKLIWTLGFIYVCVSAPLQLSQLLYRLVWFCFVSFIHFIWFCVHMHKSLASKTSDLKTLFLLLLFLFLFVIIVVPNECVRVRQCDPECWLFIWCHFWLDFIRCMRVYHSFITLVLFGHFLQIAFSSEKLCPSNWWAHENKISTVVFNTQKGPNRFHLTVSFELFLPILYTVPCPPPTPLQSSAFIIFSIINTNTMKYYVC